MVVDHLAIDAIVRPCLVFFAFARHAVMSGHMCMWMWMWVWMWMWMWVCVYVAMARHACTYPVGSCGRRPAPAYGLAHGSSWEVSSLELSSLELSSLEVSELELTSVRAGAGSRAFHHPARYHRQIADRMRALAPVLLMLLALCLALCLPLLRSLARRPLASPALATPEMREHCRLQRKTGQCFL